MLDKDKKIIIVYVGVKKIDKGEIPEYCKSLIDRFSFIFLQFVHIF